MPSMSRLTVFTVRSLLVMILTIAQCEPMKTQWKVSGMSCGHCVRAITQAIQALDPQAQIQVNLAQATVNIESSLTQAAIAAAIEEAGYAVQSAEV
jgi:copper chaperone